MREFLRRHSYAIAVVVGIVLVAGLFSYFNDGFSGGVVVEVHECSLTWSHSGESSAHYVEILQSKLKPGYLILVDNDNRDIVCLDSETGEQRRKYENSHEDSLNGYVLSDSYVRVVDNGAGQYVDVDVNDCLEKSTPRKRMKGDIIMEDYYDVPYDNMDYYLSVDSLNTVRILEWDGVSSKKDAKFAFERNGHSVVNINVDDVDGSRYLVVWSDGKVIEYKVSGDFTYYERIDWYDNGLDAEFLDNGVVVVSEDGRMHYFNSEGEYRTESLGDILGEGYTIGEFDLILSSSGHDKEQFLFSLHPERGTTKIVSVDCRV
tara:strand:- start:775 stop:1728 length:954 start_codon:yes stop_codon:yes gene_type:complete